MNRIVLTLIGIITLQFCSCNARPGQIKKNENGKIFIVINKKDTYKFDTINLTGSQKLYNPGPEIIYTEYKQPVTNIIAPNKNKIDTVIITPKSGYILLEYTYYGYYKKFCLLSKGDSVIVDYINGKPYFKILNEKTYSFDNAFDEKFNNSEPLPLTIAYFKYNSIWDNPKKEEFIKRSIEKLFELIEKLKL